MKTKPITAMERVAYAHGLDFAKTQFYDEIVVLEYGNFMLPDSRIIPAVRQVTVTGIKALYKLLGY